MAVGTTSSADARGVGTHVARRLAHLAAAGLTTAIVLPVLALPAHAPVPHGEDQGDATVAALPAPLREDPPDTRTDGGRTPSPDPVPGSSIPSPPAVQTPDPTGRPTTHADCRIAPEFPLQPRTRFGTSISTSEKLLPDSLADEEARFGPMSVIRTFDPTIPPDGAWSRRKDAVGSRMLVHSFRMPTAEVLAGRHDAALRAWFSESPTEPVIVWNYVHEPEVLEREGALDPVEYRKAFRHVAQIAGSLCRDNLFPAMILTGWTADPRSGRDWRTYYAGDEYVSLIAWDPYNSASKTPTRYAEPERLFRHVVEASEESGKPYGIAETGSERISGDEAGTGRAAWLDRAAAWFAANDAQFVTYFQSTRNGNFVLLDTPSVDVWSSWVARGR